MAKINCTIIQALNCYAIWHGDHSPIRETGIRELDMRLADAFRMLLFRPAPEARLDYLGREVMRRPRRNDVDDLYTAELTRWWLDIFEDQRKPTYPHHNEGETPCDLSGSTRSTLASMNT